MPNGTLIFETTRNEPGTQRLVGVNEQFTSVDHVKIIPVSDGVVDVEIDGDKTVNTVDRAFDLFLRRLHPSKFKMLLTVYDHAKGEQRDYVLTYHPTEKSEVAFGWDQYNYADYTFVLRGHLKGTHQLVNTPTMHMFEVEEALTAEQQRVKDLEAEVQRLKAALTTPQPRPQGKVMDPTLAMRIKKSIRYNAHAPVHGEGMCATYPQKTVYYNKEVQPFYRAVYEAFRGPVKDGHKVVRTCGCTDCCNPEHLAEL